MQVLSCAPAQVRDSFSHYGGESPRGLDTDLYGETNEKDSWGPYSLWPTRRFRVDSREAGLPESRDYFLCADRLPLPPKKQARPNR